MSSEIKPELGEGEDAPLSGIISRFVVVAKRDKCWVLSLRGLSNLFPSFSPRGEVRVGVVFWFVGSC